MAKTKSKESKSKGEINKEIKSVKKKSKLSRLVLGIFIFVVLIVVGLYSLGSNMDTEYSYSDDMNKVIAAFGKPDSFTIVWDRNAEDRIETWNYTELGETFSFKNGEFSYREHKDFNIPEDAESFTIDFQPKDFYNLLSYSDVNVLLETSPTSEGTLDSSLLGGNTMLYSYDNWIEVGEFNGEIVYITKNIKYVGEADLKSSDANGQLFNTKYDYSFNISTSKDKITEKISTEYGYESFVYCFSSDEFEADEVCGKNSYPLFIIDVMSSEQYKENIENNPMGDLYTKLGEKDGNYFVFFHSNGDVPDDAPDFKEIISSFKFGGNQ